MIPWHYLRHLPQSMWTLAVATLLNRMGVMAMPFLVLYLTQVLGFSEARAGFTFGLYGLGMLAGAPLGGWLSDRVGAARVLVGALFGGGVLMMAFPLFRTPLAVQALALLWPLVADTARPAALAVITAVVAPDQRRQAIALNRLAINLGMSVGPVVGGVLAAWSFPALFIVDGISSIVAGVYLLRHLRELDVRPARAPDVVPRLPVWRDRGLVLFLLPLVAASAVFAVQFGPLSLYVVTDLGYSTVVYGVLGAVNTVLIVFFEVPINGWTHKWPLYRGLLLGGVLVALGVGGLAFATHPLALGMGIAVAAFGEMLLFPLSATHVADMAPPGQAGQYMGAYSFAFGLAFALGPWLGTVSLGHYGAFATFAGAGVIGLAAALALGRTPTGLPAHR